MRVERTASPDAEWDRFAEATPGAGLAHAAAWARVLADAYGLEPVYLAARDAEGRLAGVLPLARLRDLRGGRELVSLPFHDAGGILARSPEAERALLEAALAEVRGAGDRALELRQREPLAAAPAAPPGDRVDLVLPLAADPEAQWRALPAKVRNQTRKATRTGLELADDALEGFYGPFCENMRDLGSPAHARRFFDAMARAFGPRLRFVVARDGPDGRAVGGLVAIHYADAVTVPWASTLRAERSRCPNNLIYWEALRWAVARSARELDFGRSPRGSGTHRFKRGWGARERPLAWVRLAPDGRPVPLAPPGQSGVLRTLSRAWTHLPVPVATWLGARLRAHLSA